MNEKFCFLIGLESFVEVEVDASLGVKQEEYNDEGYCYYVIDGLRIKNLKVVGKEVSEEDILQMAEDKLTPMLEDMDPAADYCEEPDDHYDDMDDAACYFGVEY